MIYKGFEKDWIAEYRGRKYLYASRTEAEAGLVMLKEAAAAADALKNRK